MNNLNKRFNRLYDVSIYNQFRLRVGIVNKFGPYEPVWEYIKYV